MGNGVNLASRLEGVNKEFGTSVIISDSTYAAAKDDVEVRELALIQVKGKTVAVRIYELLGLKGRTEPERVRLARRFEEGLRLYRERRWSEAQEVFREMTDKTSEIYAKLCDRHAAEPPPADWGGVYVMEHK
jgi:adenylate cyclase